jgi:hypothetical protein
MQMGSQTAVGTTRSTENWSTVSTFNHAASRASSRLDPESHSSCMMSFTPVYIHEGRVGWSWRGTRQLDRKSCSTISEVRPFSARYRIRSIMGSKLDSRQGSFTHSVRLRVGAPVGSASRSWASACTSTESSLQRSHLLGDTGVM